MYIRDMSIRRTFHVAACIVLLSAPSIASAQGAKESSPPEFARSVDRLRPGQWVWASEIAPSGPILVYVDLSKQIAIVYRNGVRIGASTISSGKAGHATPTGVFTILQKDAEHRSSKYHHAPMPYQQRLTWDGVALHAGGIPGYPESHGCVPLPYGFARDLFAITDLGVTVVVQGNAAKHVRTSDNSLLAGFDSGGRPTTQPPLTDETYRWHPELSPAGPVTIIVSKSDQRIVVLRNGIEIGRSVAGIDDPDSGSHVISLSEKDGKPHWVYIALPGHTTDEDREVDEAVLNRVRVPRAFLALVKPLIQPGTTILVTNSSVGASTGANLTVMDAVAPKP